MAQYIDKSALLEYLNQLYEKHSTSNSVDEGCVVINDIEYFIDTLEVKEVDLEKEISSSMNNLCELGCYAQSLLDNPEAYEFAKPFPKEVDDEIANFAKHFFELGLKAMKGELNYELAK